MTTERILKWVEYTALNKEITPGRERVINETGLSIYINGELLSTAMIMPKLKKEFIIGHLFGQGIIRDVADIESLTIVKDTARVTLSSAKPGLNSLATVTSDFRISADDIIEGLKATLRSPIFAETEAVHSTGLFTAGASQVCLAEDIGRHNSLDKVIGYGLLHMIDFSHTFVCSTGRQPSEMIIRCGNAGIPVITTKGVPTTLAIEIAQKTGITIVGLVRRDGMIIYSNPERVRHP